MNTPWHKVPRTRKYKAFKLLAIANLTLLVINLLSFVFISQPRQAPVQAQKEELLCLIVCPAGSPTCDFGTCALAPIVTTNGVSSITQTAAIASGTVASDGGDAVTERGFVLATSSEPTILDNKFIVAGTTGSFNYNFTGLTDSTTYYVRAYASNTVALAYGASVQFTTLAPGEEPAEEEQPVTQGGGLPAPPFFTPEQLKEFLVPDAQINDRTVVRLEHIIDAHGQSTAVRAEDSLISLTGYYNAFDGSTNIRDALVIFSISDKDFHGYATAGEEGRFYWRLPDALPAGVHIVTVQAFSPYNAALNVTSQYIFEIILPEEPVAPPVTPPDIVDVIPPPLVIPPPQPPISSIGDLYILNTAVVEPEGGLVQTNELDVRTLVESLDPATQEAFELIFRVFDKNGARLYQSSKEITVLDRFVDISRIVTSFDLLPGDYLLAVELKRGDLRYVATHVFAIGLHSFTISAGISVPAAQIQAGLLASAFILYLLLLFLIYLMYREYRRAKQALHHITGKDLLDQGMIG